MVTGLGRCLSGSQAHQLLQVLSAVDLASFEAARDDLQVGLVQHELIIGRDRRATHPIAARLSRRCDLSRSRARHHTSA